MTLMCYLCLCSQRYSCPRRTSRSLEAVATTRTTTTLGLTTQLTKFLAIQPVTGVRCLIWCCYYLLHRSTLRFTAAVASRFCAIVVRVYLPRSRAQIMWAGCFWAQFSRELARLYEYSYLGPLLIMNIHTLSMRDAHYYAIRRNCVHSLPKLLVV